MVPRWKIFAGIALAYLASAFLMRYVTITDKPFVSAEKLAAGARQMGVQVKSTVAGFAASLASLPVGRIASGKTEPTPAVTARNPAPPVAVPSSGMVFETLPTSAPPPVNYPTAPLVLPTAPPTTAPLPPTRPPAPTARPQPTAVPTKAPEPTPDLPAGYVRPGTTIDEVFNIASQKSCVPANLLKAFVAQEAPGVLTWSDKSVRLYNAYDWWHRVTEKKQVCSGYGYYPETGLIPDDSLFAGQQCKEGINGDTVSHSLGAGQMLEYYWNKTYKKKTEQALGVATADRRVVLDALVGFGINIKEGTKNPGGCDNWEFKYIIKAACVNTGGGSAYSYYYGIICRNYNKFSGQNNNCDNVASMIVPDSYCQLK